MCWIFVFIALKSDKIRVKLEMEDVFLQTWGKSETKHQHTAEWQQQNIWQSKLI